MTANPTRLSDQALAQCDLDQTRLSQLCDIARQAAQAGAGPLRDLFGRLEMVREKGRAGDLVTEADLAAEKAVLGLLQRETPEIAILSEESGHQDGSGELQWCVDPLDGTTNYAHGLPFFATSVGLTWRGQPLLGALAVPALQQLYWAAPGLGCWCNDLEMKVSNCSRLADSLLATGFAYDRIQRRDNNYAEFAWFTHRSHGVRRIGAAALDLALVAAGRMDGYWERGLSAWDLAAGVVLVEQAGGVVSAYDGGQFNLLEGRVIACTPGLHQPLIDGLASCQPLAPASYGVEELDGMPSTSP